jgi:hypothetical protein
LHIYFFLGGFGSIIEFAYERRLLSARVIPLLTVLIFKRASSSPYAAMTTMERMLTKRAAPPELALGLKYKSTLISMVATAVAIWMLDGGRSWATSGPAGSNVWAEGGDLLTLGVASPTPPIEMGQKPAPMEVRPQDEKTESIQIRTQDA